MNFNSQCEKIIEVTTATENVIVNKIKLAECYVHNEIAKRIDKAHHVNVLMDFIKKRNTMAK